MYKKSKPSFIELCSMGEALLEEIDDYIDLWNESSQKAELHEFLGMTWEEYSAWVVEPDILPFIVTAHMEKEPLRKILIRQNEHRLAARAADPKISQQIIDWLRSKGDID